MKESESSTVAERKRLRRNGIPKLKNEKGELRPVGEGMEDEFEIGLVGKES